VNPSPYRWIGDPAQAMALEAEMFRRGGGALAVWSTARCLVVPRSLSRRPGFAEACEDLLRRGFPVVVRSSGGGIVPQGPGILNVTITAPIGLHERSPTRDYAWLCAPLCALLAERGIPARRGLTSGSFCDGAHNVVVGDRKLAGTAQRRGRSTALLHLVLLVDPALQPVLDAIRRLRRGIGDLSPVRDEAHTTLATLGLAPANLSLVASEIGARFDRHLRQRVAQPHGARPRSASPA